MRDQGAEPNLCQLTKEEESSSTQLSKEAGLISIHLSKEVGSNSTLSQLYSTAANSTRISKRRRVDIGVKRTVGYAGGSAFTSDITSDIAISPSHQASRAAAFLLQAMSQSGEGALVTEGNGNVLRKLLKRQADAYEDAMTPVTMTTASSNNNVISQLLHKRSATPTNASAHNSNSFPSPTSDEGVHDDSGSDPPSPRTHSRTLSSPHNGHTSPPSSVRLSPPPERLNTNTHTRTHTLPSPERERLSDEHLRAKRARVENIIRGIGHSPSTLATPTSSFCPAFSSSSSMRGGECERDGSLGDAGEMLMLRENKRKQRLPQQQHQQEQQQQQQQSVRPQHLLVDERSRHRLQERRQLKHQLEDMQKQLRQLQEKFFTVYDSTDSEGPSDDPRVPSNEPCVPSDDLSEDSARSDDAGQDEAPRPHRRRRQRSDHAPAPSSENDSAHFLQRARAHFLLRQRELSERAQSQTPLSDTPPGPGEGRRLAETLKAELNSAVGQVVDSVVKVFAKPLPPQSRSPTLLMPSALELTSLGGVPLPLPLPSAAGDQTEALPLVVRKNRAETPQQPGSGLVAPGGLPPLPHPALHPSSLSAGLAFAPQHAAFRPPFPLPLMGYPFQASYPGNKDSRGGSPPDSVSMETYSSSASLLRSKMAASMHHHFGQSQRAVSPNSQSGASSADGLSLSLIKAECNDLHDMADISPYSNATIQEGLSPNHLKKAKLMFFYSRYPSSNMLKIYFSDVKFNRCITSQLIKWFSNFREFYYIQMEKFARQAISEGVASSDDITVTRDSELFRALNMHYNKANDYEVPERFLEVAQVTLKEFFSAIAGGRDGDPSWKKAIYKVICKLDADVPETFKSPHCLQELLHD
ncbi:prospero homeobox protein 1-like [Engraulis encrasicolus]|uniref:prospero homeobox protein 1-like n=1 Tax=Engraulis encrasicolus TaxID=184585 RepID=UPI002FD0D38B